jgi:hypothetical protein
MDRDGKMGVHLDVPINGFAGRLEVIEGPTGRRQRTEAEKARIVAESLMPDVRVADLARKAPDPIRWKWPGGLNQRCPITGADRRFGI